MSRGKEYLSIVTEKIEKKIEELGMTIEEVQKDIESMHAYYWENYTEMDEYGYENFDNQQALLAQRICTQNCHKQHIWRIFITRGDDRSSSTHRP